MSETSPEPGEDGPPIEEVAPDPYAQIHQALNRARATHELGAEWYLTDFLVVGVAQSFNPEHKGMSVSFHVGPEADPPPHRILGLLQYALTRYKHTVSCCIDHGDGDDEEEVEG